MTQESNLRTCSRCHSTMLLEFYDKNRKGEYFKLCNNCRHKKKEYREENKEEISEYRDTHKEQIAATCKKYNDEHKLERKEYYDNNYDKIMARKDAYAAKCRANPLECSNCGKSVLKYMVARHQATYTCQTFGMENKPTWDEWEKQRLEQLAS